MALIQARRGSTRFPDKVMALIDGKPMLQHVVDHAKQIDGLDDVWIVAPQDDTFPGVQASMCWGIGIPEDDVLRRFAFAAGWTNADVIMRLTGDCPALDPVLCRDMLNAFMLADDLDYLSNDWHTSGYPSGLDCEIFTSDALFKADTSAEDHADREHVTPWIKRHLRCRIAYAEETWMGPSKLSVDTPEDLAVVAAWMTR